jgi:hypothetical protein
MKHFPKGHTLLPKEKKRVSRPEEEIRRCFSRQIRPGRIEARKVSGRIERFRD